MHRPVGGLQFLRPCFYRGAAHLLLDMIRPGGVAFFQVPQALDGIIHPREFRDLHTSLRERGDIKDIIPSIVPTSHGPIVDSAIIVKAL
jgi:hypothetical protein